MRVLNRLTTEYSDREDRIRLAGQLHDGQAVVLWLTRRLLDRLLPHLALWLESRHAGLPRADLLQGFAQEKARQLLAPQDPVRTPAHSLGWLVRSVDLQPGEAHLRLTFRAGDEAASVDFAPLPLRQWLEILLLGYRAGEWPLTAWPEWMTATGAAPNASRAPVWH